MCACICLQLKQKWWRNSPVFLIYVFGAIRIWSTRLYIIFIVMAKIPRPKLPKWILLNYQRLSSPSPLSINCACSSWRCPHTFAVSLSNFTNFHSFKKRREIRHPSALTWMTLNVPCIICTLCVCVFNVVVRTHFASILYRIPILIHRNGFYSWARNGW